MLTGTLGVYSFFLLNLKKKNSHVNLSLYHIIMSHVKVTVMFKCLISFNAYICYFYLIQSHFFFK